MRSGDDDDEDVELLGELIMIQSEIAKHQVANIDAYKASKRDLNAIEKEEEKNRYNV